MQRLRVRAVGVLLMHQGEKLADIEAFRRAWPLRAMAKQSLGAARSGSSLQHRFIPIRVFWLSTSMTCT